MMLAVLMAAMLVLSACGKRESLSETMQNAWAASAERKSFTFDGSFKLDKLKLSSMDESELAFLGELGDISVTVSGAYTQEPLQFEMILRLELSGDLSISFDVPFIMTADKMYLRVPDIPMLPLGDLAGKFIELDLAELAEQEGIDLSELAAVDFEMQRRLAVDLMNIMFKHLDEKEYLQEVKKDEVPGLPGDVKADRYVKFSITNDNLETLVTTLIEKLLPEFIDLLMENEDYRTALGVSESDLKEAKEELSGDDTASIREGLEELKEMFNIHEFSMTSAIKGNEIVYQVLKLDFEVEPEPGETARLGLTYDIRYDNINKDVTFKYGIPSDTISLDELIEQSFLFGAGF